MAPECYQFIDQRRRRLSLPEVRLDGSQRNFGEHERGSTKFSRAGAAEGAPCKPFEARFELLRLISDSAF